MKAIWIICLSTMISAEGYSQTVTTTYCSQNQAYISIGMTIQEVISACGQPSRKSLSHQPYQQKVPVLELIYNNQGTAKAFYGVWAIPVGATTGSSLTVDIINDKVYSVQLNGMNNRAFSLCGGVAIVKGDPVSKVYAACGNPSVVNNSYIITQEGAIAAYPETWTYELPYQPILTLTFVNGKLESITD